MPPKTDAGEGSSITPKTPAKGSKIDEDFKLVWAILTQMDKLGNMSSINWEEVRNQIGANTVKTTRNRYYVLRSRMDKQGLGFEAAAEGASNATTPGETTTPKTRSTPRKRKEKGEEAEVDANGDGEDEATTATPSKKPKKAPRKTAKQIKAAEEGTEDDTTIEGDIEGATGDI